MSKGVLNSQSIVFIVYIYRIPSFELRFLKLFKFTIVLIFAFNFSLLQSFKNLIISPYFSRREPRTRILIVLTKQKKKKVEYIQLEITNQKNNHMKFPLCCFSILPKLARTFAQIGTKFGLNGTKLCPSWYSKFCPNWH